MLQEKYLYKAWIMLCHSGDFYLCEEAKTFYICLNVVLFLQLCIVVFWMYDFFFDC